MRALPTPFLLSLSQSEPKDGLLSPVLSAAGEGKEQEGDGWGSDTGFGGGGGGGGGGSGGGQYPTDRRKYVARTVIGQAPSSGTGFVGGRSVATMGGETGRGVVGAARSAMYDTFKQVKLFFIGTIIQVLTRVLFVSAGSYYRTVVLSDVDL